MVGVGDVRGYGYAVAEAKVLAADGEREVFSIGFKWSVMGCWIVRFMGIIDSVVGTTIDDPGLCTLFQKLADSKNVFCNDEPGP